jgi:hypothetical protein
MEGESVYGRDMSTLVPGGRGVMIPRATRDGASRGVDHNAPQIVNIDPHINGGVVVDLAQIDSNTMEQAVDEASRATDDPGEAAFAAYALVADPTAPGHSDNVAINRGNGLLAQTIYGQNGMAVANQTLRAPRQAPLAMPGSYVVPQASPGGGQLPDPPPRRQPPPPVSQLRGRLPRQAEPQPYADYYQEPEPPPPPEEPRPLRRILGPLPENLRSSFRPQPPQPHVPPAPAVLQQVTFELQVGGQFECFYHEVLLDRSNLILVLDHQQPLQMRYFPPVIEEPVAVLWRGQGDRPDRLFLCHTTGIRFRHGQHEFCVLIIEQESDLQGQPAET